jgi:hypothetical protein
MFLVIVFTAASIHKKPAALEGSGRALGLFSE